MSSSLTKLTLAFYKLTFAVPIKPSAGIIFFCPDDQTILLTHRSKKMKNKPGTWDIPGGQPEKQDNSTFETASRETYEEIGTVAENKNPIAFHSIRTNEHYYIVFFIPLTKNEKKVLIENIVLSDENNGYEWFDYKNIPKDTHFDFTWIPSKLADITHNYAL